MENTILATQEQTTPSITRKIGKITYKANMHFKSEGDTKVGDCLKRIVKHNLNENLNKI